MFKRLVKPYHAYRRFGCAAVSLGFGCAMGGVLGLGDDIERAAELELQNYLLFNLIAAGLCFVTAVAIAIRRVNRKSVDEKLMEYGDSLGDDKAHVAKPTEKPSRFAWTLLILAAAICAVNMMLAIDATALESRKFDHISSKVATCKATALTFEGVEKMVCEEQNDEFLEDVRFCAAERIEEEKESAASTSDGAGDKKEAVQAPNILSRRRLGDPVDGKALVEFVTKELKICAEGRLVRGLAELILAGVIVGFLAMGVVFLVVAALFGRLLDEDEEEERKAIEVEMVEGKRLLAAAEANRASVPGEDGGAVNYETPANARATKSDDSPAKRQSSADGRPSRVSRVAPLPQMRASNSRGSLRIDGHRHSGMPADGRPTTRETLAEYPSEALGRGRAPADSQRPPSELNVLQAYKALKKLARAPVSRLEGERVEGMALRAFDQWARKEIGVQSAALLNFRMIQRAWLGLSREVVWDEKQRLVVGLMSPEAALEWAGRVKQSRGQHGLDVSSEVQAVETVFDQMDRDGDGDVSFEDFQQFSMQASEEAGEQISTAKIQEQFKELDLHRDGVITFDEVACCWELSP